MDSQIALTMLVFFLNILIVVELLWVLIVEYEFKISFLLTINLHVEFLVSEVSNPASINSYYS